jgi:uncharacterized protein YbjT (DUF2867 family)
LAKGSKLRALTRDPDSPNARQLAAAGVEVVKGDFNERASIRNAVKGVDTVFAMSTPYEKGVEKETENGVALADIAKKAGVRHFVYSSVSDADKDTGIPHFDSKFRVEEHIKEIGLPYTIIGPVYFMENLLGPFVMPALKSGAFAQPLPKHRKLQMVSVKNIGEFAALVIGKRDEHLNRRVDIAGDELTGAELVKLVSSVSGKRIVYKELPLDKMLEEQRDFGLMYQWFERAGYSVPLKVLRDNYPEVNWLGFAEWAAMQDWSVIKGGARTSTG